MHLTMIFIDGLGLSSEQDNPVVIAHTPNIDKLLGGHFLAENGEREYRNSVLKDHNKKM